MCVQTSTFISTPILKREERTNLLTLQYTIIKGKTTSIRKGKDRCNREESKKKINLTLIWPNPTTIAAVPHDKSKMVFDSPIDTGKHLLMVHSQMASM